MFRPAGQAEGDAVQGFLCDEMLLRLARWLRAAGYDAAMGACGTNDADLVARAVMENRLLLTRDRKILERRAAAGRTLLLAGTGIEDWVAELTVRLNLDWQCRPFSRCLVCNTELVPAPPSLHHRVPPGAADPAVVRHCPGCERLYWPGSHVRRMARQLEQWGGRG